MAQWCCHVELNGSPLGIKEATFAKAETLLHGHSFVQTIDSFQIIISRVLLIWLDGRMVIINNLGAYALKVPIRITNYGRKRCTDSGTLPLRCFEWRTNTSTWKGRPELTSTTGLEPSTNSHIWSHVQERPRQTGETQTHVIHSIVFDNRLAKLPKYDQKNQSPRGYKKAKKFDRKLSSLPESDRTDHRPKKNERVRLRREGSAIQRRKGERSYN